MKKLGLFCIVMLTCGCLAACGNSNNSKENSSISSLKAENSSLKAKKHSSHKDRNRDSKNHESTNSNNNQTSKSNNSTQSTGQKPSNKNDVGSHQAGNQSNGDPRKGDWHNDPDLWANVQSNDHWQGSMYQNATPQERYNYLEDNHDYWAARDPHYNDPNYYLNNN